jgi:protein arginine N-methyltransferase 2
MASFAERYRASDLTFDENGIYWVNPSDNETYQVMMGWEQPIMDKMAELCVSEGDDVLEIGFGMGILSDAIQTRKPKSHTIIECHKDIIPKLHEWASDKSNVTIIEGLWVDKMPLMQTKFDAILQDTYGDDFLNALPFHVDLVRKPKCKFTYWNMPTDLGFENVEYHEVDINPPSNKYYNSTKYNIPIVNYS